MTSAIDPSKPTSGDALTQDVRDNFQIAADEIGALQDDSTAQDATIADLTDQVQLLAQQVTALAQQVTGLQSQLLSSGSWNWQDAPQSIDTGIVTGGVGVDTDDPSVAANLFISNTAAGGADYFSQLGSLVPGDGFLLWGGGNSLRYTVSGNPWAYADYFTFPVVFVTATGGEPADGSPVTLQFLYVATPPPPVTPPSSDELA